MFKGTIKGVDQEIQPDGITGLVAVIELTAEDGTVEVRRVGFPLEKPAEEIAAECKAIVATINADIARAADNADLIEAHKVADETAKALTGVEL